MKERLLKIVEEKIEVGMKQLEEMELTNPSYREVLNNMAELVGLSESVPKPFKLKVGDHFDESGDGVAIFWSQTCGYCDELKKDLIPLFNEQKVNTFMFCTSCEEGKEVAKKYNVTQVPIVVYVYKGIVQHIQMGYPAQNGVEKNRKETLEKINKYLRG